MNHLTQTLPGAERHARETSQWADPEMARTLLTADLDVVELLRAAPRPSPLAEYARSWFSQGGEDGIIAEITSRLGIHQGTFVEIGAADGVQNTTRALAERGWSGHWYDGDPALVAAARALNMPGVGVHEAFVDAENVAGLVAAAGVTETPDVCVLDIDGNDYWVMDALLARFHPTLIVCEYNADHRFEWMRAYDPARTWDGSWDYGASLMAWERLMGMHGYGLLGSDPNGVNAFFADLRRLDGRFDVLSSTACYIPPTHNGGCVGAPRISPRRGTPVDPTLSQRWEQVDVSRVELIGPTVRPAGSPISLIANVTNACPFGLASDAVNAGAIITPLGDPHAQMADPVRTRIDYIASGATRPVAVGAVLPTTPGLYRVCPTLVHEGHTWRPVTETPGVEITVVAP